MGLTRTWLLYNYFFLSKDDRCCITINMRLTINASMVFLRGVIFYVCSLQKLLSDAWK